MCDRETVSGMVLELQLHHGETRTYRVNASPIIAENGTARGVLVSFDDITQLEKRKVQLTQMLQQLSKLQRGDLLSNRVRAHVACPKCGKKGPWMRLRTEGVVSLTLADSRSQNLWLPV